MFIKKIIKGTSPAEYEKQTLFRIRNKRVVSSQEGFTLIEMIVTLIIVGILTAIGGLGISQAINGYIDVRENAAATQKTQTALSRINREIIEMISISSAATANIIPINGTNNCFSTSNCVRAIGLVGNEVRIAVGSDSPTNGDVLVDNVSNFSLRYFQGANATTTWPTGKDRELSSVEVTLALTRDDGQPLRPITALISPRNNGNLGGANVPITSMEPPGGWGCFVATAAYGDAAHPMVQILRDFRSQHLIHWPGGKWMIKQYYHHGPAAADFIRHRPLAMWAARCLLAPIAAFAFCLMYAPLALLFILFVSLIITRGLFTVVRRRLKAGYEVINSRGSILIGIIVTMIIMALLAAVMLRLFSSSYMNQVYADRARKAYYLAESGFYYAALKYRNASSVAQKNTVLSTTMNNRTYAFSGNVGSFRTVIYPFWFNTTGTVTAGSSNPNIAATFYGTLPTQFTSSSNGYIKVGSDYYRYVGMTLSGSPVTSVTFNGLNPTPPTTTVNAISTGADVYPVVKTAGNQSLTKGGTLTIQGTGQDLFPVYNGNFTISATSGAQPTMAAFNYRKRVGNQLTYITMSDPAQNYNWNYSIAIPPSSNVILGKFIRLESTGIAGGTSRTVTYNAPIGLTSGGGFQDAKSPLATMESSTNFYTGDYAAGTQTYNYSDGSQKVMKINSMVGSPSGLLGWLAGLIAWGFSGCSASQWNWTGYMDYNTDAKLASCWMDAQGCLSYDAQVKIKNQEPYYFAGMTFRTRNNSGQSDIYTYGVSFVKGKEHRINIFGAKWRDTYDDITTCYNYDYIHDRLVPGSRGIGGDGYDNGVSGDELYEFNTIPLEYDNWVLGYYDRYSKPGIILWKRNSRGFFQLAYRELFANDKIVNYNSSDNSYRLVDYSTLMVRVAEGYALTFTNGGGSSGGEIKEGDIITNSDNSKSARVVMTPILTSATGKKADWTNNAAAGTLVLANIPTPTDSSTTFSSGESVYVNGVQLATAGTFTNTKKNYIRVYFTDPTARGTANNTEIDNPATGTPNRKANPQGYANWPPDSLTDLEADTTKDYVTLVQWTDARPELVPQISTDFWTVQSGWNNTIGDYLYKLPFSGSGTCVNAYPTTSINVPAGQYVVKINMDDYSSGYLNYSLGSYNHTAKSTGNGYIIETVTVATGGNLTLKACHDSGAFWANFKIRSISVRPAANTSVASTSEPTSIIVDNELLSPAWTTSSTISSFLGPDGSTVGDVIGLLTAGNTGTSTYYDDFQIKCKRNAGTGFMTPIQE